MTIRLRTTDILSYALLAAPLAFAGMPLYVHAPDYYATQFGVSLSAMGFILLFIRLFDAVQDPLIGRLSDRYASYRLPVITVSAILLVISFTALFQLPANASPTLWFAVTMILATTAFSILSINLQTIGGMWSRDKNNKTRISAYREAFGLVGLLFAVILPAVLIQTNPPASAFLIVSAGLAGLMIISLAVFIKWYHTHKSETKNTDYSAARILVPVRTRKLYIAYFVSMLASAIPAILVLFFIRDRLQSEAYTGLFLALYFISGALGMPLWQYISRKSSKEFAWIIGMILAVFSFIWAVFLTPDTAWQYAIICITSGIALGSDLALPPAILADHIHETQKEGEAGSQYSTLTFISKASLAIASAIVLPLLEFSGYKPGQDNSQDALFTLSIAYAGIPCLIKCMAIMVMWNKNFTGDINVQTTDGARTGHSHSSGSNRNV